jgi:uncharacterized membrane protein YdfJ with MMPL/SSD domain
VLATGVAITLLASVTLTPALISLFGQKLLWPARLKRSQRKATSFWNRTGRQITLRPLLFAVPLIIILAIPYIALPQITFSANMLRQMPSDMDSVEGYNLLEEHFSTGALNPLTIVIESDRSLTGADSLKAIETVADSLSGVNGVSGVHYFLAPSGELEQLSQQVRDTGSAISIASLGQLSSQMSIFQTAGEEIQALAVEYPGVTQSDHFQATAAALQTISATAGQIDPGALQNIPGQVEQIKQSAAAAADELGALAAEFRLEASTPFTDWLRQTYFSADGMLTRIEAALSEDPYSSTSIEAVSRVRESVKTELEDSPLAGASAYTGGVSADQADILAVNNADFGRVLALAIAGILLVTIILLRSLVAPLYMIATVILNFGATLGISAWLFLDVLGQNSMIYMLPIFVFVILIAVGSDYNIFLVSRIPAKSPPKTLKEAIYHSVANTGGVITPAELS